VCFSRKPIPGHFNGHDEIQPDQKKVSEILSIQTRWFKMGMDKTQAAKVSGAEAIFGKVRDKHAAPVADKDVVYGTPTVDKESQLSSDLM
jgi:hypothetical protein